MLFTRNTLNFEEGGAILTKRSLAKPKRRYIFKNMYIDSRPWFTSVFALKWGKAQITL